MLMYSLEQKSYLFEEILQARCERIFQARSSKYEAENSQTGTLQVKGRANYVVLCSVTAERCHTHNIFTTAKRENTWGCLAILATVMHKLILIA